MITKSEMKKLETHSKKHKGGMQSVHIKTMQKHMQKGHSFIVAHNKASKKDKKMKSSKKNKQKKYNYNL